MRILHTMLRVKNLDNAITFYTELLGMQLLRKQDFPEGKFTLAFVGYGDEANNTVIELTYNWETHAYNLGDAFGHIAIEVDDVYETCNTGTATISKKLQDKEIVNNIGCKIDNFP